MSKIRTRRAVRTAGSKANLDAQCNRHLYDAGVCVDGVGVVKALSALDDHHALATAHALVGAIDALAATGAAEELIALGAGASATEVAAVVDRATSEAAAHGDANVAVEALAAAARRSGYTDLVIVQDGDITRITGRSADELQVADFAVAVDAEALDVVIDVDIDTVADHVPARDPRAGQTCVPSLRAARELQSELDREASERGVVVDPVVTWPRPTRGGSARKTRRAEERSTFREAEA